MNRSLPACLIAVTLASASAPAAAGLQEDLNTCAQIEHGAQRLSCYDGLSQRETPNPAAPPKPAEEFGLQPAPKEAEAKNIQSHLSGPFRGWQPGTVFELRNGQVWQCTNDDRGHYPGIPDNPEVTITRSYFGAYWMEVAGVNRKIKVKRIK